MSWTPKRADPGTVARWESLASAVKEDLAVAGLPIVPGDLRFDTTVSAGARVYVDPLDEDGGVFISWEAHDVLRSAAVDALVRRDLEDHCLHYSGAVAEVMQDAIAAILTKAGYAVRKDANDMAPYEMQVLEQGTGPSWRDWLAARTERHAAGTGSGQSAPASAAESSSPKRSSSSSGE
ncbi:hypothetical protein GCM10022247_10870 [Allokutzneria multivorans]|uniref:Uncharacterized protein n=1 Tax=Allokutzneria multivorans TaxID=1142134 RepID=A0ABP7R738_9PSEU